MLPPCITGGSQKGTGTLPFFPNAECLGTAGGGGAVMALSLSWRSSVQAVTSYSEGVIFKFSVSFSGTLPPEKPLIYTCTPCIFSVLVERDGGKGTQQLGPDSMSARDQGHVLCHSRHVTRSSDSALAQRASLTSASRAG